MPAYRIYTLGDECLVVKARVIEAKADADAVALDEAMLEGSDLEVWTGTRRVSNLRALGDEIKPAEWCRCGASRC